MGTTVNELGIKHKKTAAIAFRKASFPWLLLAPSILLLVLVISGPLLGTLWLSFTDWDGISNPHFNGVDNYIRLVQDEVFFAALFNVMKWMVYFLTIPIFLSLMIARLLSRLGRGQLLYRTIIFMPYIISTVVTAKIWQWIYNPNLGINFILEKMGLTGLTHLWLGDPHIALFSVALAESWHSMGFTIVLFLVGMQQTDKTLEEAAKVEGATGLQTFWHVVLPQLRPTIIMIYMLTLIWSFSSFDYVYIMTQGGPGNASELLATYMYKLAIYNRDSGYASSVAMSMGLFSIVVIMGFGYLRKKGWDV